MIYIEQNLRQIILLCKALEIYPFSVAHISVQVFYSLNLASIHHKDNSVISGGGTILRNFSIFISCIGLEKSRNFKLPNFNLRRLIHIPQNFSTSDTLEITILQYSMLHNILNLSYRVLFFYCSALKMTKC